MGITGLLPFVRKAWREVSLAEFEGATVAVDIYCWIHKGAFACAEALALNQPTYQFVAYCMKLVKLLQRFNIKPILVFDGKELPAKSDTEAKRREMRENLRQRAARLLATGRKSEARECFERSINVTQEMALGVLQAARELGVDCLVAPYESDAQLACLCRPGGLADMALTEDSDLLAFGCERVFFKLDLNAGRGIVIERDRLLETTGLSADRFRHMCLLAGCDYHPGIQGVGLTTAARVMTRTRLGDFGSLLSKLRMYLPRLDGALLSPDEIEALMRAERTFLHQVVFDPLLCCQRPLTPYPSDRTPAEFYFAGQAEPDTRLALELALGNVDFITNAAIGSYNPNRDPRLQQQQQQQLPQHLVSIFNPCYCPRPLERRVFKTGAEDVAGATQQNAPEALTGRQQQVTVRYRMPKLPSGDAEDPLDSLSQYFSKQKNQEKKAEERERRKEEETAKAKEILSQYCIPEQEAREQLAPGQQEERAAEEEQEQQKREQAKENAPPTSPVFNHVSSNQFATSPPPCKRARFSLDQGCCSPPSMLAASPEKAPMAIEKALTFLHAIHPPEELQTFQTPSRKPFTALPPLSDETTKKSPSSTVSSPASASVSASKQARVSGLTSKKSGKETQKSADSFFAYFKKMEKEKLQLS